tara:strand:- start:5038 stop:6840 length:1803 start_codon:yes stop_codon:yes gene_type:complete
MVIDDRQINPVDQKAAELLLNERLKNFTGPISARDIRRLSILQAPRTGGDLNLRTSILDAPRTGGQPLASEQMLQGQNITGDLDPNLTPGLLPPKFAFLEKKPSGGRLTDSDFKGIDRASLRDEDLFRTDRRLREIAEERGEQLQGMQAGPKTPDEQQQERSEDSLLGPEDVRSAIRTLISDRRAEERGSDGTQEPITTFVNTLNKDKTQGQQKETIDDFFKEYMDVMPEYEGKTRFEKGMDLAKFGLLIAGGKSQNAFDNFSAAMEKMGDTFTEDAKEKRIFKRQVELGKAKYGLQKINELRNQRMQDARNISYFVATSDLTLADGQKIKKGEMFNLGMDYIAENGVPQNSQPSDFYVETQKALATRDANLAKALKDTRISTSDAKSIRNEYDDNLNGINESNRAIKNIDDLTQGMVDKQGNIFGASGIFQATKENLNALMNKSSIDPNSREKFSRKEWEGKLALLIQQSIPLALRENQSANSISNFDVQNFVKGYFDDIGLRERGKFGFSTAFSNPNVIFEKLLELRNLAVSKRQRAISNLDSIDEEVTGLQLKSGREVSTILEPFQQKRESATAQTKKLPATLVQDKDNPNLFRKSK